MAVKRRIREADITLTFELEPAVSQWTVVSENRDGSRVTYEGDGYTLDLEEERGKDYTLVEFDLRRASGEPFTLHQYVVKTESSTANLDRIWMPWYLSTFVEAVGLFHYATSVPWSVDHLRVGDAYQTMADRGIPIIVGMNRSGTTTLAVGFLDQRIETDMRYRAMTAFASGLQPKGTVRYRLQRPIDGYSLGTMTEHHDGLFISSGSFWFDTMQRLREVHDEKMGRELRPSPDEAWEPLWVPWGGAEGNWEWGREEALQADEVWAGAQIAAELGMRGMINWGGWFRDVLPWFNVEEFVWAWPDAIGDFEPLPEKYSDLLGFVRKLQSAGVMVMPWISPWMAGRQTKVREKVKHALVEVDMDPSDPRYNAATSYLCPRTPFTQEWVPELMARVMREYQLDGYTVDMIDQAPIWPCIADHEHNYDSIGLAVADTLARMRAAMDAVNPNAVIEFRARYSNISNLYNATAHRAPDSGFTASYAMDRRCCLLLRSYVPTGVAVHFDPLWWHRETKVQSVAKMLSTMVVSGVPQIGNDLVNLPDEHRRLVKAWLSFYHEHKEDFRYGQMRPVQNDAEFSTIKVERGRKAFVSYGSYPAYRVPLSPDAEEIHLFNCTNEDWLHTMLLNVTGDFTATVHDHDLSPISEMKLSGVEDSLLVDLGVPQGGMVTLRKMGEYTT